jgi:uncharacterized protein YsxB (DUF464 family)
MIKVQVTRQNGQAVGFSVFNHGSTNVCAAVSILVINTVNSIESLTEMGQDGFNCGFSEDGGYISFELKDKDNRDAQAGLLLDAMVFGLCSVRDQHPNEVSVKEVTRND